MNLDYHNVNQFWLKLDQLVATHKLTIDRPKGTKHPNYLSFIYPFDYGYLENTISGDGAGIDVWVGSLNNQKVTAIICCVDLKKRDSEIKILLSCTIQESQQILEIQNKGEQSAILFIRDD
jgi:inorganic pyrophosphatase